MAEYNNNDVVDQNPLPEKMKKTQFPEGLRVLAVDDDMTCLKTLALMLQKCQYQVTETTKATEALDLLRKNEDNYDIVITDVRMPDMDGFELLRIIGLEMDVPVIMMSANDDTSNVMKGVMNGARDYLVKPVRMLELKNIWQHVMRKTILNPNKSSVMTKEDMENLPLKKRRDRSMEIEEENTPPDGGSVAAKKPRFAWTKELHKKFVDAVQQLDVERAVPKKILEILNEPQLTREIIASHLQKYRNFLKKQQDSLSEERTSNGGLNWTRGGVLNTTSTTSSDNKFLSVVGQANSSGEYSSSVDGFLSFRDQFLSKPDTNTSLLNEGLMILPLNQQNLLLQQNTQPSQMADQVRLPKTIPLLENVPSAPAWVTNPSRMMVDDYIDMPSQIPNFGCVQSGAPIGYNTNFGTVQAGPLGFPGFIVRQPFPNNVPMAGLVSYPCPPGAFNIVRTPNHMLGNASTQFSPISQPNSLHGQHDGISSVFNGRTGSDFIGWSTGGHHAIDKSTVNGQGTHTQLLTDTIEIEDDEINAAVKQFGKTSAPVL